MALIAIASASRAGQDGETCSEWALCLKIALLEIESHRSFCDSCILILFREMLAFVETSCPGRHASLLVEASEMDPATNGILNSSKQMLLPTT